MHRMKCRERHGGQRKMSWRVEERHIEMDIKEVVEDRRVRGDALK